MDIKDYLTVEEVAFALRLHPYTVRRLSRERKTPAFKFGGRWRFDVEEIEEWRRNQSRSQLAPNR